jgi:hypothetical protein
VRLNIVKCKLGVGFENSKVLVEMESGKDIGKPLVKHVSSNFHVTRSLLTSPRAFL